MHKILMMSMNRYSGHLPNDDEDSRHPPPNDIEHQHTRSRSRHSSTNSRSQSPDKSFSDNPYETKTSGSSSRAEIVDSHSYPPSLSSSVTSASSFASSSHIIREGKKLNKKRRMPPAPLQLKPPVIQPVVVTPSLSPKPKEVIHPAVNGPVVVEPSGDDWDDTWGDD
ncbi:hypothetical protein BDP27DRAFT_506855 [Rhodocollybia butyracea]|uniref:Uncharacterized protein n=1 Tax=Rhodocollybia butyracea TaxID=206335 RepID=A0A9P5PA51_9AGAR|nr:hypothetical protein BDP27DRAFT_506855 [Rhodocollybia butyracea]